MLQAVCCLTPSLSLCPWETAQLDLGKPPPGVSRVTALSHSHRRSKQGGLIYSITFLGSMRVPGSLVFILF